MNYSKHARRSHSFVLFVIALVAQFIAGIYSTALAVPSTYDVQFIGGFHKAVNGSGHAVGWIIDNGVSRGWVFKGGSRTLLPVPSGWHSQANDINDNGVIVGSAGADGSASGPVFWQPNGSGYDMITINTPADDEYGEATAINNYGDIIGKRTFMTEFPPGAITQVTRGFLYSSSGVLTLDLSNEGFPALPTDINDNVQIVGGQYRKTQGLIEDLGAPTDDPGYTHSYINAINSSAQVAAQTVLAVSSTLYTASRYSDGVGWKVLTFQGSYDAGLGINDGGDVTFEASFFCASGTGKPGVYLQSEGSSYCLDNLLADANWQLDGPFYESDINNIGQILVYGNNSTTGQVGAVLLTPAGPISVPAAPQNLTANVITGASGNVVQLSWIDASDNETGFRVERRLSGSSTWETIVTLNSGIQAYNDNNVAFDQTYEYRIFATGLAGDSPASNMVTAVSPPAPPVAPTADANGPYTGTVGIAVTFDGSGSFDSDGSIVSYAWDFGDGNTGTGVSPSHAYAAAGSYTVTLTVTDDDGLTASATSTADIAPVIIPGPVAPQELSATVEKKAKTINVLLSWIDASNNESGFRVERSVSGDNVWTVIATLGSDIQGYTDSNVDFKQSYDYRVFATSQLGDSVASNVVTVVASVSKGNPKSPKKLNAKVERGGKANRVLLSWIDESDNEVSFRIERSISGENSWKTVATPVADSTSFADSEVGFDMTYDYRMFAVGEEGDSLASNMVTVVSPADDSSSGAGAFDFFGMLFLLLLGGIFRKKIS